MKYICIVSTNGIGGVWSVVAESLRLLKLRFEIKVILFTKNNDLKNNVLTFFAEENINYEIININLSNGWLFDIAKIFYIKRIKLTINESKEKIIIHSHDAYTAGFYLYFLKSKNINMFCTFHGVLLKGNNFKSKLSNFLTKFIRIPLLIASEAHLISCDPYSVPNLKKHFYKNVVIDIAPNGVQKYNYGSNKNWSRGNNHIFTIAYASRFHPLKGWKIVAEAAEIVLQKGYKINLLFAGSGECEKDVIEWCNSKDYCTYLGQVKNIRQNLFPIIDLHILPTTFPEGLPMIILETMSAGIPTITTDIGSNRYAVKDSINGFIIEANPYDVANKIELILNDDSLYKLLSQNSERIWREKFSEISMVQNYIDIFNKYSI